MTTSGRNSGEARGASPKWMAWGLVGGIVLLGFALRVYRLEEQSLWWDDYNGLAHLTMDGFLSSMLESRRVNPEGAPLYHIVQYLVAFVIGPGEFAQRMLNAGIGTLTIIVVFLIGKNSFGIRAGLIAALMFAMSTPHIYHAQSLRSYPLAMLLGTLALLAMERLLTQTGRRWLYLNAIANGALCITHLFGLFGVLAHAVAALLVLRHRRVPQLHHWAKAQALCLLPAVALVLTMQRRTGDDFWHFSFPTPLFILQDLFADDVADFSLNRTDASANLFGLALDQQFLTTAMGLAMGMFFVCVAIWAFVRTVTAPSIHTEETASADEHAHSRMLLMLCQWAIPVMLIVALAIIWRPVVYPRYTLYAVTGLYVLAGAFVSIPRSHSIRTVLILLIVALYAFQLSLLITSHTRTQWRQVANALESHAQVDDLIVVGGFGPPEINHRTIRYHLSRNLTTPVTAGHSTLDVLEQARCHLRRRRDRASTPNIWYVFNSHYGRTPHEVPARIFDANGVTYDMRIYDAEESLSLFRIVAWDQALSETPILRPNLDALDDYNGYDHTEDMLRMGLDPQDEQMRHVFERAIESGLIFGKDQDIATYYVMSFIVMGAFDEARTSLQSMEKHMGTNLELLRWMLYLAEGDLDHALRISIENIERPEAHLLLAINLWGAGEHEAASAVYTSLRPNLSRNQVRPLSLLDAMFLEDPAALHGLALAYRSELKPHGDRMHDLFFIIAGLEEWVSACQPKWTPQPASTIILTEAMQHAREIGGGSNAGFQQHTE